MMTKIGKILGALILLIIFASIRAEEMDEFTNYRGIDEEEILAMINNSQQTRANIESNMEKRDIASITEEERILWEELNEVLSTPPEQ